MAKYYSPFVKGPRSCVRNVRACPTRTSVEERISMHCLSLARPTNSQISFLSPIPAYPCPFRYFHQLHLMPPFFLRFQYFSLPLSCFPPPHQPLHPSLHFHFSYWKNFPAQFQLWDSYTSPISVKLNFFFFHFSQLPSLFTRLCLLLTHSMSPSCDLLSNSICGTHLRSSW